MPKMQCWAKDQGPDTLGESAYEQGSAEKSGRVASQPIMCRIGDVDIDAPEDEADEWTGSQ